MPPAALRVRPTRVCVAALLIQAFLFALLLALAPQLHNRIHSDAQQSQHECVITLINGGNCDQAGPPPLVEPFAARVQFCTLPTANSSWVASLFLSASVFEHAPPAVS